MGAALGLRLCARGALPAGAWGLCSGGSRAGSGDGGASADASTERLGALGRLRAAGRDGAQGFGLLGSVRACASFTRQARAPQEPTARAPRDQTHADGTARPDATARSISRRAPIPRACPRQSKAPKPPQAEKAPHKSALSLSPSAAPKRGEELKAVINIQYEAIDIVNKPDGGQTDRGWLN